MRLSGFGFDGDSPVRPAAPAPADFGQRLKILLRSGRPGFLGAVLIVLWGSLGSDYALPIHLVVLSFLVFALLLGGVVFSLRAAEAIHWSARVAVALVLTILSIPYLRAETDVIHLASKHIASLAVLCLVWVTLSVVPTGKASRPRRAAAVALCVWLCGGLIIWGLQTTEGGTWLTHGPQRGFGVLYSLVARSRQPNPRAFLEQFGASQVDSLSAAPSSLARDSNEEWRGRDIAVIMIDTLRDDPLEDDRPLSDTMPFLRRAASQGVLFTDVEASATWTLPSVASFFTGMRPESLGVFCGEDTLPQRAETLAESLASMGYQTAAIVNNPYLFHDRGFSQGFTTFKEIRDPTSTDAESVSALALEWLRTNRVQGSPTFIYTHFMEPHTPYRHAGALRLPGRHSLSGYAQELRYLDGVLSSFVPSLAEALQEPWAILITSDHGEQFGERSLFGHGNSVYPEVTDVPAVMLTSDGRHSRCDSRLELRDFHDAILRLALERDEDLVQWAAGHSRPLRVATAFKTPSSTALRRYQPQSVVRVLGLETSEWLYVRTGFGDIEELYDLQRDRDVRRNLISDRRAEARKLAQLIPSAVRLSARSESLLLSGDDRDRLRALGYLD